MAGSGVAHNPPQGKSTSQNVSSANGNKEEEEMVEFKDDFQLPNLTRDTLQQLKCRGCTIWLSHWFCESSMVRKTSLLPFSPTTWANTKQWPIMNIETSPKEIDDWLQYIPQAKPCMKGGTITPLCWLGWVFPLQNLSKSWVLGTRRRTLAFGHSHCNWNSWSPWMVFIFNKNHGHQDYTIIEYGPYSRCTSRTKVKDDQFGTPRASEAQGSGASAPSLCRWNGCGNG